MARLLSHHRRPRLSPHSVNVRGYFSLQSHPASVDFGNAASRLNTRNTPKLPISLGYPGALAIQIPRRSRARREALSRAADKQPDEASRSSFPH